MRGPFATPAEVCLPLGITKYVTGDDNGLTRVSAFHAAAPKHLTTFPLKWKGEGVGFQMCAALTKAIRV